MAIMTPETAGVIITKAARAHIRRRALGPADPAWAGADGADVIDAAIVVDARDAAAADAAARAAAHDAGRKLFVGRMSRRTTDASLWTYFARFGEVEDVALIKDKHSGLPRGFGFVKFADASVAEAVLAQTHKLDGRFVDLKHAVPRDRAAPPDGGGGAAAHGRATSQPPAAPPLAGAPPLMMAPMMMPPMPLHAVAPPPVATVPPALKIFVGGLAQSVTSADFKRYFSQFGTVVDSCVMFDRQTQRSRGFGFVTFLAEGEAHDVLARRHHIHNKPVEVKAAEPKEPAGGGAGGAPPLPPMMVCADDDALHARAAALPSAYPPGVDGHGAPLICMYSVPPYAGTVPYGPAPYYRGPTSAGPSAPPGYWPVQQPTSMPTSTVMGGVPYPVYPPPQYMTAAPPVSTAPATMPAVAAIPVAVVAATTVPAAPGAPPAVVAGAAGVPPGMLAPGIVDSNPIYGTYAFKPAFDKATLPTSADDAKAMPPAMLPPTTGANMFAKEESASTTMSSDQTTEGTTMSPKEEGAETAAMPNLNQQASFP